MIGTREAYGPILGLFGLVTGLACGSHFGIFAALAFGLLGLIAGFFVGLFYGVGFGLLFDLLPKARPDSRVWTISKWSIPLALLIFFVQIGFLFAFGLGGVLLVKWARSAA